MIHIIKKNFFIIFFLSILTLGLSITKDYGVSSDEYNARLKGFITLNYLGEKFIPEINKKLKGDKNLPKLSEAGPVKYYGPVFDSAVALFEVLLGIEEKKNQFLFKHYLNFIIFFISLVYFFKTCELRFKNQYLAYIGVIILLFSPRIFANSFYNSKDIIFMSFLIIATFYGLNFFLKQSFRNGFLFALFSGLTIDIRILGIILPVSIFFIIFFENFLNKRNINKKFYTYILTIFF